jgi:hypothetical protein
MVDALADYKTPMPRQDPPALPYLDDPNHSCYDVHLSLGITSNGGAEPTNVVDTNLMNLYWSLK